MKQLTKSKKNNKSKVMIGIVLGIVVLLLILGYLLFFGTNSKNGGRCDYEYEISNKTFSKVKNKIKEIDQVKKVDIHLNVCIIKIIVELSADVEIDTIKTKMTESLEEFDKELLDSYDLELFIKSDNKESDKYPLIVSKHKSQKDFYWE